MHRPFDWAIHAHADDSPSLRMTSGWSIGMIPVRCRGHAGLRSAKLESPGAYGLGAMRAAAGIDGDFAQAFRTLFCCGISRRGRFPRAGNEKVDWGHNTKIDGGGDQEK